MTSTTSRWTALLSAVVLCGCSDSSPPPTGERPPGDRGTGTPTLSLSSTSLDLGQADCGGAATGSKTLTIKNTGTGPLNWSAAIEPQGAFTLGGDKSGALQPGASATLTVTATVPASATAATTTTAMLVLLTDDPQHEQATVPLKVTAAGGTLTLAPAAVDFGLVPLKSVSADVPVTLTNAGNKALTVTIVQPTNKQLTLVWTGAPAALTLAPGAVAPGLVARFTPTSAVPASGTVTLNVTGAICGTSVGAISLAGEGSAGVVGVQPGSLDFGKIACGTTAAAKTITLTNTGTAGFDFTAALTAGAKSAYTASPATGNVVAGGKATITLTPKAVPAASLTTPDLFGDTLTVTTTALGDVVHTIPLHQTAHGSRLAISATTLAFGGVPISTTKTAPLVLSNTGNTPATVTLTTTAPFSISPTGALLVDVGQKIPITVTYAPTMIQSNQSTIAIAGSPGDVLCAPLPDAVALTGAGTTGAIALSAATIDFETTECGATAAAQTLTITNSGTASFSWSAALDKGASSPYTITPTSGTLAPDATADITITSKPIPSTSAVTPGLYNDAITITTSGITGDKPHSVPLTQSATGAILSFTPATPLSFGNVPAGMSSTAQVSVTNTGTEGATVTFAISNGPVFSLDWTGPEYIDGGQTTGLTANFAPTASGAKTASVTLSVASGTVLCAPLPTLAATGTGTMGSVGLSASELSFGQVNCGSQAAKQTLVISNSGTAVFTFDAELADTADWPYTLSATTGTVPAGGSVSLVVTPPAIPADSAITPANLFNDTLTITTDVLGDTPHAVALHMAARGAILAVAASSVSFPSTNVGSTATSTFTVTNSGNAPATISFSSPNPVFAVSPQARVTLATETYTATASFKPTAVVDYIAVIALTVPTGTAICSPLPTIDFDGSGQ